MRNAEYINKLLQANKKIYIDTASLMDVDELELFISNIRETMLRNCRKITLPRAVCLELTRHLGSNIVDKRMKALKVMELMSENKDIFDLENNDLDESEILKAFADSELLAKLTLDKKNCGQLLITNDRNLSRDAFDLNNLASCKGYRIMVCFINRFGDLKMCECIEKGIQQTKTEELNQRTISEIESKIEVIVDTVQKDSVNKTRKNSLISKLSLPIALFIFGYGVGKYGKSTVKILKSMF